MVVTEVRITRRQQAAEGAIAEAVAPAHRVDAGDTVAEDVVLRRLRNQIGDGADASTGDPALRIVKRGRPLSKAVLMGETPHGVVGITEDVFVGIAHPGLEPALVVLVVGPFTLCIAHGHAPVELVVAHLDGCGGSKGTSALGHAGATPEGVVAVGDVGRGL